MLTEVIYSLFSANGGERVILRMRMSESGGQEKVLHLLLPESVYWCRSVLPGVADYVRRQTDWFMVNHDSAEGLLRSLSREPLSVGVLGSIHPDLLDQLNRSEKMPMVSITGRWRETGVSMVTHDSQAIGAMAAEHLLEKGFTHFAYVGVGNHPLSNDRFEGFRKRLETEGIGVVQVGRQELSGDGSLLRDWLREQTFPLGIFAAHDRCARKICWEAERMGFRIPDDVGVIGVDNDPYQCELTRTPLSSVALRFHELGYRAAERLHCIIRGEEKGREAVLVPPEKVVERTSTSFFAVADDLARQTLRKIACPPEKGGRWTVATLAQDLGVSKSSLEKRFKKATGKTLFEEIHRQRMEQARQLLEKTQRSVEEISDQIGISDSKRFAKLFKERFGDTPLAFRKKRRLA